MIKKPVRTIIGAIAAAAARWMERTSAQREAAIAAVSARTGYASSMVEYAFDRLFGTFDRHGLEAIVTDELGSLDVLDRFVDRVGRPRARALPVGRVCIISSRTTVGVAIVPAVFALCAKCEVLVKDREDHLAAEFFTTVADELEAPRNAIAVETWTGESETTDLGSFDAVVAFGSDATMARIARQLPTTTRFIPYGSKASGGYVSRDALQDSVGARDLARRVAFDLLLYETEGCLSLHALFVERGGAVSPAEFGTMLTDAISSAAVELPVGSADVRRQARVAMARDLATFAAHDTASIHSHPAASHLVVVDPSWDEAPQFLPRTIAIRSIDDPAQATAYFERHGVPIEALAIAGSTAGIAAAAQAMKAARITNLGLLQAPPLGGFHGGRPRIAEFVRWIADET
ncbi:MAG TPA: acyl-CoA reductase [Candidatus Cybelea sp.]|jgi:hypothetical protein|nr:acyl-CoA reductase [Candidatus Cybelea sp.]